MANAQLKAICPLKYPVLSVFSVATAVSSLPRVLRRRWRGPGGLRKCSSAQVRPAQVPMGLNELFPLFCHFKLSGSLASLPFFKLYQQAPASGPLHLLFPVLIYSDLCSNLAASERTCGSSYLKQPLVLYSDLFLFFLHQTSPYLPWLVWLSRLSAGL